MSLRTQLIGFIGVLLALALIIELVRRQKLRTGYSLLWLFTGLMALLLVLWQDLVGMLTQLMGIQSPRSLLFTAGILFTLLILLEHSLTLGILWRQNKDLAQGTALLEWRVRQLEARMADSDASSPTALDRELDPASSPQGDLPGDLCEKRILETI